MKLYLKRILFAVISVQMAMVASFELFAQNVTVTGTVKDAATNELLVGATVMVKGTTNGVSTDITPSKQRQKMFWFAPSSVTRAWNPRSDPRLLWTMLFSLTTSCLTLL